MNGVEFFLSFCPQRLKNTKKYLILLFCKTDCEVKCLGLFICPKYIFNISLYVPRTELKYSIFEIFKTIFKKIKRFKSLIRLIL